MLGRAAGCGADHRLDSRVLVRCAPLVTVALDELDHGQERRPFVAIRQGVVARQAVAEQPRLGLEVWIELMKSG